MFENTSMIHGMNFTLKNNYNNEELDEICKNLFDVPYSEFTENVKMIPLYKYGYSARNGMLSIFRYGIGMATGTTLFQVHGSAFETLPDLDVIKLCKYIIDNKGNVTLLDIAKDDTDDLLPFNEIIKLSDVDNYKDRISTYLCNDYNKKGVFYTNPPTYIKQNARSLIYGKHKNRITIYDKQGLEKTDFPWIRVEFRLRRRDDTLAVIKDLADGMSIDKIMNSLLTKYLNFKEAGAIRKCDRKTMDWWIKFTNDEPKRKFTRRIYKTNNDIDARIERLIKYMKNNNILNNDTINLLTKELNT